MFQFKEFPNLRHLRMIQVIGRLGGVSSASRSLSTSQPAVTQAVANIELEIGAPIFERSATGTYPTVIGKQYLLRIDRYFDILDNAISQVLFSGVNDKGRQLLPVDRLITSTQLRALIVTCEQGRVNEIAQSLDLSPASLFRSARALEHVLGVPLFDRTAQGPIPNRMGNFLAREFRRAVREYELARGEILLASGPGNLEIVVGTLPMAGSHELAKATRAFMAAYPSTNVRLVSGEYHKLFADLENSRIDIIFGILRKPDWAEDINEDFLFSDQYCLVARPDHPLTKLDEVTPADLTNFDWVVPQLNTPRRARIEAIFEKEPTRPAFKLETPSLTMSRAFLLCSDTLTLLTRSEVQIDLELGILKSLRCSFLTNALRKGVTTRGDWLPTEAHRAFLECLREVTSETQHNKGEQAVKIELVS